MHRKIPIYFMAHSKPKLSSPELACCLAFAASISFLYATEASFAEQAASLQNTTVQSGKSSKTGAKELFYRQIKSKSQEPQNLGLSYVIELERDGKRSLVDNRFQFKQGDQLRFHIQSDLDAHLYILLKEGTKGGSALLFPAPGSNESSKVSAGLVSTIPREGVIEFDENPGIETLKLVLSKEKLEKDPDSFKRSILVSPKHSAQSAEAACLIDFASRAQDAVLLQKPLSTSNFPFENAVTVVSSNTNKPLAVELQLAHTGPLPDKKLETAQTVKSKPKKTEQTQLAERAPAQSPVLKENAIPPAVSDSRLVADKWALVVGISDFKNPKYNLMYPAKDAQDFADFLVKEGHFAPDHVKVLLNESATRENILTELGSKWLPENAAPKDLVLVYFATHGTSAAQDKASKNFLVAYDTNPSNAFATGIELQDLARTIKRRINSDRIVIVLDTCHSGSAEPGAKGIFDVPLFKFEDLAQGTGQLLIASAGEDQIAHDSLRYKNGIFTKHFMDGLRTNKKLIDAYQYTRKRVLDECQNDFKHKQEPVFKDGEWNGSAAMLLVPPAQPRKAK